FTSPGGGKPQPAPSSQPAPGGDGKKGPVFSDDPLPFDLLNSSDGNVRYRADKILVKGTTLAGLNVNAVWRNGEFSLRPLTGELGGGKVSVELGANARSKAVSGKVDIKGLELGTLLKDTGTS